MIAGYLGHYGISIDSNINQKIIKANKLIDEYNQKINFISDDKQMKYQFKIKRKIKQILGNC